MLSYAISAGRGRPEDVTSWAAEALEAGVDMLQVREKSLGPRELFKLAQRVKALANPGCSKVLLNERSDIALAVGLDGVHLPSDAVSAEHVRRFAPAGFTIGVSCHSIEEALRAEGEGADFVVFGPVFETPSKRAYGPPVGLDRLRETCVRLTIPVLALGGIDLSNAARCAEAGASGLAAISLFQRDIARAVRGLRG